MYRWTLVTIVGTDAHITVAGHEFLKYMLQNAYEMDKLG
jgi:hypothetical protein